MRDIEKWLNALNFEKHDNFYSLEIDSHKIEIDMQNQKINYPQLKEIGRNTTTNFSQEENFVVLDIIVLLLRQGYLPSQISIEKGYRLGHNTKSGNADVTVEDNEGNPFLIIEAKTFGEEFDKEWNNTLRDGGQLFSYEKQENKAKVLVLYASKVVDNVINRTYKAITLKDNEEFLAKLEKPRGYKDARGGNDKFETWCDVYKYDYITKGVLEDTVKTFEIDKVKSSISDLQLITHDEVQKKYNQFATILRKYNIGGRENAFDKLVNLFLTKIVDEQQNQNDLQFNWKGFANDNYFELVDRLQKLYQIGMEKFLNEKVSYVAEKQVEDAFRLRKDAAKDAILKYFKELKYFSNNDFTFLDVYNEDLFYQNSKILVEIVQMLQEIKLRNNEQNQFLGDLFEGFLDNGVKQSEGQFFTPLPIVKFIVSSLPIEKINDTTDIPKVIDYACGAGHFLNEYAEQIKSFVEKDKLKEYYSSIFGIEKEYRLSKVAKVSAFMYGQDDINIIYGDGLIKNDKIENESFSVLIANPPYSVKGFLETLSEKDRDKYELIKSVDKIDTNNSIELFFLERAYQLLKSEGIAAIIVPSSILSNGNLYVKARKMLIKQFQIIAIAEFGSKTFGSTGTNTVTLFLQKKKYPPMEAEHYKHSVKRWFENDKYLLDTDIEIVKNYCKHIGVKWDIYSKLQQGSLKDILDIEAIKEYVDVFANSSIYKNISKKKITNKYTKEMKAEELEKATLNYIKEIEEEKVYFFALATSQEKEVVIVKSPTDNAKMKEFLGYEWSKRKGNEGIKYLGATLSEDEMEVSKNQALNSIQTPLFNPLDLKDENKINTIIRNNFIKGTFSIKTELEKIVTSSKLVNMLDFTNTNFDAQIKTSVEKNIEIKSKYPLEKLYRLLVKIKGDITKIEKNKINKVGEIPVITQEKSNFISGYIDNEKPITDIPIIVYGDHSHTFKFIDFNFVRGADGTQILKTNEEKIRLKYLYNYLQTVSIENQDKYQRHFKYLKETLIPIPPIAVQEQLILEVEKLDEQYENSRMKIEEYRKKITEIFENLEILRGGGNI